MNLPRCLEALDEAIAAATSLGLDAADVRIVRDTARVRLGYPSDAYVLALAGGTGVGKSTLLNALAGEEVSLASALRPTTGTGVAWVPAAKRAELAGLLQWIGVNEIREHGGSELGAVAIIDLPDVDSVAREHRARVDELLPRVDAVVWVVDPEKYKDDLLHTSYLKRSAPVLPRQIVVLNRADLLAAEDVRRVREDLVRQLRADGLDGIDILVTSARAGPDGVSELRAWLDARVEAKRVVGERLGAEAREAIRALAARGGVEGEHRPLVDPERRDRALESVTRGVLALIDMGGLRRQAVAATRHAARPRGAGPVGHLTTAIYRLLGRARASADPAGHLRRWRMRGSIAPAIEPLRELVATCIPAAPPGLRGSLAALTDPTAIEARLSASVDRAIEAEAADLRSPASALWTLLGIGQYVVTALLLFGTLWLVSLFVVRDVPTGTVLLPFLGQIPTPVAILSGALLAGYLLALVLRWHAGFLGRRWASRVADVVSAAVRRQVRDSLLLPLEAIEASRAQLAEAVRVARESCGGQGDRMRSAS